MKLVNLANSPVAFLAEGFGRFVVGIVPRRSVSEKRRKGNMAPCVRELALLVHPRGCGNGAVFSMIQAYFDESGLGKSAKICVVAGFYGPVSEWERFDKQWSAINVEYEVPEFHARRFWGRDKTGNRVTPYSHLTDERAAKYLERLIACIQRHRIFPSLQGIVTADWYRLPEEDMTCPRFSYQS